MYTPLDNKGKVIRIGDRVRILCNEDKKFFRKIGVVTFIDTHADRAADRYTFVFVQMVTAGGGMWWHGLYLRIQPKLRKKTRSQA